MNAPMPLTPETGDEKIIDLSQLKEKKEFKYKEYTFTIGLLLENIIILCKSSKNKCFYQLKESYEELINKISFFRAFTNIYDILNIIKKLFISDKYEIKQENDEVLIILIKLVDLLGEEKTHELFLSKVEIDKNMKINMMDDKIKNLEIKIEELIKEKNEMKKTIDNLSKENLVIKKELEDFKNKFNSFILQSSSELISLVDFKESQIIKDFNEIKFVLEEIEKKGFKIKEKKLIYRATEDGDKMSDFHKKCDDESNTLMLIKTNKNFVFGGFTQTGWKNARGNDIYDDKAFCFSLNLKKIYNIINPKNALHCQSYDSRPSFGSNSYVFLIGNNFLSNSSSSTDKMVDYSGETKESEINGEQTYFQVDQLEVFKICF